MPTTSKPTLQNIKNAGSSQENLIMVNMRPNTKEFQIISLIREFNAKSYILLFIQENFDFRLLIDFISREDIFEIYIVKECNDSKVYFAYEVCAYCDSGRHSINLINRWEFQRGFAHSFKYESSFKKQFYGGDVRIGFNIMPPSIFPIGIGYDKKPLYAGPEYLLIEAIAKALNFNPILVPTKDGLACWGKNDKGEWVIVGFCSLLQHRVVDLAGFPYFPYQDSAAQKYFHLSPAYSWSRMFIVSARKQERKESRVSSSIQPSLLLAIIISTIAMSFCLLLIQRFRSTKGIHSFWDLFFQALSLLWLEPVGLRNLDNPRRIVIGLWMICSFFVISMVFGQITSTTAKPIIIGITINSIEDMKVHDFSWITFPLYDYDELLKQKLPQQAKKRKQMSQREALQFVLDHPTEYVFLTPKEAVEPIIQMHFWNGKGESPFHYSPPVNGYSPILTAFLKNKDFPFKSSIDKSILHISEAGLYMQKFYPDTLELLPKFTRNETLGDFDPLMKNQDPKFSISHLKFTLIIILSIWLVSLLIFIAELFFPDIYNFILLELGTQVRLEKNIW